MGAQTFAKDLGGAVPIRLHIDSSAALSITSRAGLSKAEYRDPASVAPGGGPQQQLDGGEDPFPNELV